MFLLFQVAFETWTERHKVEGVGAVVAEAVAVVLRTSNINLLDHLHLSVLVTHVNDLVVGGVVVEMVVEGVVLAAVLEEVLLVAVDPNNNDVIIVEDTKYCTVLMLRSNYNYELVVKRGRANLVLHDLQPVLIPTNQTDSR